MLSAMSVQLPLQFFLLLLAGWVNRHQEAVIEYLREENRVLRELHGKKRLRFTDDQRRRLAVKGKALGRRVLGEVGSLVTPDTILRWYRKPVAKKYDGSKHRGGLADRGPRRRSFPWWSGSRQRTRDLATPGFATCSATSATRSRETQSSGYSRSVA